MTAYVFLLIDKNVFEVIVISIVLNFRSMLSS